MSGSLNFICAVSSRLFMLLVVLIVSGILKDFFDLAARGVGASSGNAIGIINFWDAPSLVEVDFGDGSGSGILKLLNVSLLVFCKFLERFEAR